MGPYIIHRLLQAVVLMLIVSVVTFGLIHSAPGGPALLSDPNLGKDEVERISRNLGLTDPLPVQYGRWLGRVLRGDFGKSYSNVAPVTTLIHSRLPNTIVLTLTALAIAILVALPLGIASAIRRHSWVDYLATLLSTLGVSIPVFWFGIVLIIIFAVQLRVLPAGDMYTPGAPFSLGDRLRHLVLPAIVLSSFNLAELTRYMRSSMVGVLGEDYIRTARAKGLAGRVVLGRHALKNALIPVVTVLGILVPRAVGGAAITETVFSWPGMGRLAVEAAMTRDYPVVMGVTLTVAAIIIFSSLLTDVLYAYLDPRIRVG
ncbi:MAG: ABC transporter permease [Chloroflexota bacterium]|nr:ABC transporter permease [Chloroflexota bacterium]